MAPFDIKEVRDMMMDDELELDKLGDRKTALFCIVSDTDTTFNFIASVVYTCLLYLSDAADEEDCGVSGGCWCRRINMK